MIRKKVFKNLDEQIEILQSKGLTINDIEKTKEILLRENYFFISGYRYIFMKSVKNKVFLDGTTFEELYAFFTFDRSLRNIFFKHLLVVENNLKSIFSYQLSKQYGIREKDYLKASNFTKDITKARQVADVLHKMKRQVRVNGSQHSATRHYMINYGYIPLWILVKVLSFGIIGELYCILKPEDQQVIADYYDLDVESFMIFLPLLSNCRNLCAHEDILFDHRTQRSILDNEYHLKLKIPMENDEYIYGKNDLFAYILIFKSMLREEEFRHLVYEVDYEIARLDGKVSVIPVEKILNRIGFPNNWREIVDL
ncbi:MAG: Abi family protein [Bacilli bacterium]|nr:Abi family protein [Bacilli bacterium]MDD2932157.1 Abi family protein [Fermentimonas sp.]MDD3305176.1 Abi family protein [Bacilli bacterium]MDD4053223.1 Abi family protein [Bacilli bacterium]MDD4411253.1 Abi family protein [Bacilli bacterium]